MFNNCSKRKQAFNLARDVGLMDWQGSPTDEYKSLIVKVTGKDRMSIMTPEEADRFLEALKSLSKVTKGPPPSVLTDPWSRLWMWILVFVVIVAILFLVDQIDGTGVRSYRSVVPFRRTITWAPGASVGLFFSMVIAAFLRPHVKHHGRNSIAWTTAMIVFTPILSGIAYLLTWPKDKH